MDINRLCPGCMRELAAVQIAGIQDMGAQGAGSRSVRNTENRECRERNDKERNPGKCPYCGFDAAAYRQNSRCLPLYTILAGKYLVGAVLGEGGFGITYMGYDLNMEARIAIKEYFPVELVSRDTTSMTGDRVISLSGDKSATYKQGLKKYVSEAQNVSRFSEIPGVVSVKDFFYENETAYIVMEYIDGISLKDYLKERGGRLSEEESLAIMKPVLEALVKVHEAGITHRDISPDNIMLTFEKGEITSVKLIDFGAARMTAKNDQKSLTIILKHGYAPEEQYRTHGEQGPWTDVYAVCAVLYRMLTGQTPVPAMDRLFQDDLKSFDDLNVKVSRSTQSAILKGLAVKKEDRIQTMQELIQVLYEGKALHESGRKRLWAAAGILAVAVLAAGIGAAAWSSSKKESLAGPAGIAAEEQGELIAQDSMDVWSESGVLEERPTQESSEMETVLVQDEDRSDLGPQIVWPQVDTMVAAGTTHVLALRGDGTVSAAGNNSFGQCDVEEWEHIAAVYAGGNLSAGLRTDGRVVAAGQTEIEESVASWNGCISLAVGNGFILGLSENGNVISAGNNRYGCCDTGDWVGMESIWAGDYVSIGITKEGRIKLAGLLDGQEETKDKVEQWTDMKKVIAYYGGRMTFFGLRRDGTVVCEGQEKDSVEGLEDFQNIVDITAGDGYMTGLTEDGLLIAPSSNWVNNQEDEISTWRDMVAITGTACNVIGLRRDGTIQVTEPTWYGNSTLDEIVSSDHALQAVWDSSSLAVLYEDGTIRNVGYKPYYAVEEGIDETADWEDTEKLAFCSSVLAGLSKGKVRFTTSHVASWDREQEESMEAAGAQPWEMSQALWNLVEQTPHLAEKWQDVKDISGGPCHIAALLEDGTVRAAGYPFDLNRTDYATGLTKDGACEVDGWTNICQVLAIDGQTIGLKTDGTLVATGEMPEEWKGYRDLIGIWGNGYNVAAVTKDGFVQQLYGENDLGLANTAGWNEIVQLSVGSYHTAGLRADGTVVAVGSNYCGQCDVEGWTDVVSVSAGPAATIGITSEGRILMAGTLPDDYFKAEQWPAISLD